MWCFSIGLLFMFGCSALSVGPSGDVILEVMNPRAEIPPPAFFPPSPRVEELSGTKVGIYWLGKAGGDNFWDGVEELLRDRYPAATIVRYRGPFDLGDERAATISKEVDTVLYGVGD
jgi:hypothetical protein